MIAAGIYEVKRRSTELDRALTVDNLVGDNDIEAFELGQPFFSSAMRDDGRACILEYFATGDVVIVMMAVNQILDRRLRNLADFVQMGVFAACGRP